MMDRPQYTRYFTPEVEPADRFAYWRTWYSEAAEAAMRLDPVDRLSSDFDSSAEVLRFGEITLAELHCGPAVGSWHLSATETRDLFRVIIFLRGVNVTAHWHGRDMSLSNGYALLHGRTGGWWRAPLGLRTIQVNVPRRLLATPDALLDRFTDEQPVQADPMFLAMVRPMLVGAAGNLAALACAPEAELAALWLAAITMLVRSLGGRDMAGSDLTVARRLAAERFIDAHLADPGLNPDDVAAALNVSRRTVYQALATDGPGVASMIRERRLQRADGILRDPRHRQRPISDIAAEVGLPSAAHFSRLFRARFGQSPRERRTGAPPSTTPHVGGDTQPRIDDHAGASPSAGS